MDINLDNFNELLNKIHKIEEEFFIDIAYDREFTVNIHLENIGEIEDKLYFDEDDENGL